MMGKPTIRRATRSDVLQLRQTLARAFQDDPAMSWWIPEATKRERFGPDYFGLLLECIYLPEGEVYMTEDGRAAALWALPDRWQVPTTAKSPLLSVMVRASGSNLPRAAQMQKLMEAKHGERSDPHYYLPFIGTSPDWRGRWYGTALLSHMLDRCDVEGVAAYLESTSEGNLALYSRHGFEVIDELNWPGGGPPFWPMWRNPNQPQAPT
jgi:ribosomal protein S18 acetylase RimI-like enzyme